MLRKNNTEEVGQGELYSPEYAIHINPQQDGKTSRFGEEGNTVVRRGVAKDMRTVMGRVKDLLVEKLADASVPSDAIESAKCFVETVIGDVTSATQGLTKDALHRIKSRFADVLPLSPSLTSKMVDDAEKEAACGGGGCGREKLDTKASDHLKNDGQNKGQMSASSTKPISRL